MIGTEHISLTQSGAIRARSRGIVLLTMGCLLLFAPGAQAAIATSASGSSRAGSVRSGMSEGAGSSLEAAAAKAGSTGRTVAMSLIGLAFSVAAIALAFKRDFKEAAGVFAVGIVCVMLATPTGVSVLRDTVSSLFGSH
jgi:glucose uptake protein GlcU